MGLPVWLRLREKIPIKIIIMLYSIKNYIIIMMCIKHLLVTLILGDFIGV